MFCCSEDECDEDSCLLIYLDTTIAAEGFDSLICLKKRVTDTKRDRVIQIRSPHPFIMINIFGL